MDITILDTEFQIIGILDSYSSLIWTDRFYTPGDFELTMILDEYWLSLLQKNNYLQCPASDRTMIIEKLNITTDVESGAMLLVSGRSLESVLSRRIVWGQRMLNGNFQDEMGLLFSDTIINPTDPDRKISNFIFEASTDPEIINLTIDAQYNGETLLDVVQRNCEDRKIGYRIVVDPSNQLIFSWVVGIDRSYDQTSVAFVIFSPKFDNLLTSSYVESISTYKNVVLVGGEGEGSARVYTTVGSGQGLNRREQFINASDISSDVGNHKVLTPAEYQAVLQQRGVESLASKDYADVQLFDGTIETTNSYRYGEDFYMGDIVQFQNEYGHEGQVRIVELIISIDESGTEIYPTFSTEL